MRFGLWTPRFFLPGTGSRRWSRQRSWTQRSSRWGRGHTECCPSGPCTSQEDSWTREQDTQINCSTRDSWCTYSKQSDWPAVDWKVPGTHEVQSVAPGCGNEATRHMRREERQEMQQRTHRRLLGACWADIAVRRRVVVAELANRALGAHGGAGCGSKPAVRAGRALLAAHSRSKLAGLAGVTKQQQEDVSSRKAIKERASPTSQTGPGSLQRCQRGSPGTK